VFISYRREDGRRYARALAAALKSRKDTINAYFDQWAAPPGGAELPRSLLLALKRARVLVVIATDGALNHSAYVAKEIEEFERTARGVVAIDSGCLKKARAEKRCWPAVENGVWTDEAVRNVEQGVVTPEVIEFVAAAVGDARQERHLQKVARWTLTGALSVIALASGISWFMAGRVSEAQTNRDRALDDQLRSQHARMLAKIGADAAAEERDRQQKLAYALRLAQDATAYLQQHPVKLRIAARYAKAALHQINELRTDSLEVDQAARQVLKYMPVVHDPLKQRDARDVLAISSDGHMAAIRTRHGAIEIVNTTDKSAVILENSRSLSVNGVVFADDGPRCGTIIGDKEGHWVAFQIWDYKTGKPFGSRIPAPSPNTSFVLDPTGRYVASIYRNNDRDELHLRVVDPNRKETTEAPEQPYDGPMAFSPDGALIAFIRNWHLQCWPWQKSGEPFRMGSDDDVTAQQLLFTPHGELLVRSAKSDHGAISLWNVGPNVRKPVWERSGNPFQDLVLSRDGSQLLTWDQHGFTLYDMSRGEITTAMPAPLILRAAVTSDGLYVVTSGQLGITTVYDADERRELERVLLPTGSLPLAAGVDDSGTITVATSHHIQQWDSRGSIPYRDGQSLRAFTFFPDADVVALLPSVDPGKSAPVKFFDAGGNALQSRTHAVALNEDRVLATASGERLLIGDNRGGIRIYTPAGPLRPLIIRDADRRIDALAVSRTSQYIAAATPGGIYVWSDWTSAHPHFTRLRNARNTTALTFGKSDDQLIAGTSAGSVEVWDWRRASIVRTMKHGSPVTTISVDPAGHLAASAGGKRPVSIWDLQSGAKKELPDSGQTYRVEFSPAGKTIATLTYDADFFLRIWRLDQPAVIAQEQFDDGAYGLAFSPSGRSIAFGGIDFTILNPKDLEQAFCKRIDCADPELGALLRR
jgi:WD40 repeat protein